MDGVFSTTVLMSHPTHPRPLTWEHLLADLTGKEPLSAVNDSLVAPQVTTLSEDLIAQDASERVAQASMSEYLPHNKISE